MASIDRQVFLDYLERHYGAPLDRFGTALLDTALRAERRKWRPLTAACRNAERDLRDYLAGHLRRSDLENTGAAVTQALEAILDDL